MILQTSIDEVMNRADIVDVVGQFLRLKKRGSNYIASCPFHSEKTASFNVNPARGIYKCFGCGKGGNPVNFIQEHEKMSYPDAIKWLGNYYKIDILETERSEAQVQKDHRAESMRIINEWAATWFTDQMHETEEGVAVGRKYVWDRGIDSDSMSKFRIGYCPRSGYAFSDAAMAAGHSRELLMALGLCREYEGRLQDMYRGRVIFPIESVNGKVIGFGARLIKDEPRQPKYINSPESEIYHKGAVVYGLYHARTEVSKMDECFLVEGYTDVISLDQGGVQNVVSSSGTALTEDQLRAIGKLTKNLTILYDGDAAGIKAALRGVDMAVALGFRTGIVQLPEGDDPDTFIKREGVASFRDYVKGNRANVLDFRIIIGIREAGPDPVLRSRLANELADTISRLDSKEDALLRDHYVKTVSTKMGVSRLGFLQLVNIHAQKRIEQQLTPVK